MQRTISPEPSATPVAPHKAVFNVFIASENQAGFYKAGKVKDQVEELCGGEVNISSVSWNFALLRHEELRKHAVMEAAAADMIIISLADGDDLPGHVKDWMGGWQIRPQAGQAAMVVLAASERETGAQWSPDVEYLRRVAGICGLDFFCNLSGWEHPHQARTVFPLGEARTLIPRNLTPLQIPWHSGVGND